MATGRTRTRARRARRISTVALIVCISLYTVWSGCANLYGVSGGTAHKEIFSFVRAKKGTYKDKEWDLIVKPVIEKWGAFVEAYL